MREIRMLRTTWRKLETELRDGLRHRKMAKASGQLRLPAPVATAPVFDPTLGEGGDSDATPLPDHAALAEDILQSVGAFGPEVGEGLVEPIGLHILNLYALDPMAVERPLSNTAA